MEETTGKSIDVDWQPFSLSQISSDKGPDYKYWEQPEGIAQCHQGGVNQVRDHRRCVGDGPDAPEFVSTDLV